MLLLAPMAVFTTSERIRLCSILGLLIAFLSPVIALIDTPFLPAFLSGYFLPTYTGFGFFPWAAFLAFGMVTGSVIRTVKPELLGSAMLWTLALGATVVLAAHQLSSLPYSMYPKVDYWLTGPGLTAHQAGYRADYSGHLLPLGPTSLR